MKTTVHMLRGAAAILLLLLTLAAGNAAAQDSSLCRVSCDGLSVTVENGQAERYSVASIALFWSGNEGYWSQDLEGVTLPAQGEVRIDYRNIVADFNAKRDEGYPRTIVLMLENAQGEVTAQAFMGDEGEGYSFAPMLTGSLQESAEKRLPEQ